MEDFSKLIKACVNDERKAQKRLYDLFASKMMMICIRYSKSESEAEDILQESFIKIFKHLKDLREYSNVAAWIKRIVINTALNFQRSKLYLYPMVDVEHLKIAYDESVALSGFHRDELLKMIRELPLGCQVIFNLYAIEGYTHKEIAKKLNISEGTSKSQYSRAKSLLQVKLMDSDRGNYERAEQ